MHPVHHPMRTNHHCGHRGFTLVELLVAIGIVAILAGLLLTGVQSARQAVSTASVSSEIRSLETALASFHSEFGDYPPAQITLHETAAGWLADASSLGKIRKLWPQFDPTVFGTGYDLNGNGTVEADIPMYGGECLVFFLGGVCATYHETGSTLNVIVDPNGSNPSTLTATAADPIDVWVTLGFSNNPKNPFLRGGSSRKGPYFEFQPDRVRNLRESGASYLGMPEYVDSLPGQIAPYCYFKADNGSYASAVVLPGFTPASPYFQLGGVKGWNSTSFQLISPGRDGEFGSGGVYDAGKTGTLSVEDGDNITNFTTGSLN